MGAAMIRKPFKSAKLFSDFNTLQFGAVMAIVVFVLLLVFMVETKPCGSVSADLAKVSRPISMRNALREDVMKVWIMRDGMVYFGSDRIDPDSLAEKIKDRLNDRGMERKVYIAPDARARWGSVETVLDGVRSAGIIRVAFLTDQRRVATLAQ